METRTAPGAFELIALVVDFAVEILSEQSSQKVRTTGITHLLEPVSYTHLSAFMTPPSSITMVRMGFCAISVILSDSTGHRFLVFIARSISRLASRLAEDSRLS